MASEVYILPTEQSVPTARQRLPCAAHRWRWVLHVGHAHVVKRPPCRPRDGGKVFLIPQQVVQPEARSKPSSSAAISTFFQACEMTPPRLATPITRVLRARCLRLRPGPCRADRHLALQPSIRNCPTALSGRQSRIPCATFRGQLVRRVAEEQKIGRPDHSNLRQIKGFACSLARALYEDPGQPLVHQPKPRKFVQDLPELRKNHAQRRGLSPASADVPALASRARNRRAPRRKHACCA
jgi:hypothetical protein